MRHKRYFPVLVFFALLIGTEAAIALLVTANRPADMPVARGTSTLVSSDQLVDPAQVDRYMIDNLQQTGLAGAILAITKDDRILYTAGYSYTSDGSAVTPDTPMPVASLTKSFTAAAIMLLVEEGRIDLDTPVRDYLPEFELADPRGAQITVRQLLNHSSGLATHTLPPPASPPPKSLAEQIDWLRGATLAADPGAAFNYCNENYNLLALLIERVSGVSYASFLEQRLFAPLGMNASRVFLRARDPMPGVADGHILMYGTLVPQPMPDEFMGGAGGVVSSANDLARWLALHGTDENSTGGETLLSPESIAAMHTVSAPNSNYGFGWRESLDGETAYVHHSGRVQTFAAHERLYPETGYGFAFVLNTLHPFNAEATSFIWGLNDIVTGETPTIGPPIIFFGLPFAFYVDNVMAILTVLVATIGIAGSLRARAWAERRADSPWWRLGLRLTPYMAMVSGIVLLPWLMSFVNRGQPVPLDVAFSAWPPLVIFFAVAAVAGLSVAALRVARIVPIRLHG